MVLAELDKGTDLSGHVMHSPRVWLFAFCVLFLVALLIIDGHAQDWRQWRGPNRDGTAAVKLPDPWPGDLKQAWKVEVGEGHSGPVIARNKVIVFARQGEKEVILCLDTKDGREKWRHSYTAPYTPAGAAKRHGKGPFATPTIAASKVYTLGISGILTSLDITNGKRLWQRNFSGEYKNTYPQWGAANSPLIEGDMCILGVGGGNNGALAALNKDNGEAVWKLDIGGPAYASPVLADLDGHRTVVTLTQKKVVGVALKTGKLLWEMPFTTQYEMNIITPLVHKNTIIYSGYRAGTTALEITKELTPKRLWHNRRVSMFMSSPVAHGDYLYGLSQAKKGALVCVALRDGKTQWTSPGRIGEYASIVSAEDKLLVMKTDGELMVVSASPSGFKELGRSRVSDAPVWAHIAVTGNRIYVKGRTQLACFEF